MDFLIFEILNLYNISSVDVRVYASSVFVISFEIHGLAMI
jgi:hypothetical protein